MAASEPVAEVTINRLSPCAALLASLASNRREIRVASAQGGGLFMLQPSCSKYLIYCSEGGCRPAAVLDSIPSKVASS